MQDLTEPILELIRLAATDLPPDVESALRRAVEQEEPGSAARGSLETILKNVELARANSTPICQDTGTPIFYVRYPEGWSTRKLRAQIEAAVVQATKNSYLRPNSVDSLSGKNSGNNLGGSHFPSLHFEEVPGETTGFIQCPFCLKNSRVGLTHCESCGNLIESTRLPAEPEPEAAVPEPAAPVASGAALVERPDQADTHRLAHHPVPQILKETTLFTPAMLRLQPEQGQTGEKIYNLNIGDSTIGRGIDNTLAFPDEEFISRRHCSIGYHKYQYVLKDYDSANGTYVNDVRIRETILRDGDCVQIGSMRFIFDDPMERIKKKKAAAGED